MSDLWLIAAVVLFFAAVVLFCLGHALGGAICLGVFLLIVVCS